MNFKTLTKQASSWFKTPGGACDIIIGTMVRAVRNLRGHRFPGWSTAEGRKAVADILLPVLRELPGNKTGFEAEMKDLSYEQRRILLERKQLSHCMAARQDGCHVLINKKQDITYMVNEEEHLAIHFYESGTDDIQLTKQIQRARKTLAALEKRLDIAHNRRDGYLTSMPAESGSGLQLYTVLQLPCMSIAGMMQQVTRGLEKLMLNISPFYSELGDDTGHMYVIYTAPLICGGEEDMANHLYNIVYTLAEHEMQARLKMTSTEEGFSVLIDKISRAYGLLEYARRMEYAELINTLAMLRMGTVCGYVQPTDRSPNQFLAEMAACYPTMAPYTMQYLTQDVAENCSQEILRPLLCRNLIKDVIFTQNTLNSEYE